MKVRAQSVIKLLALAAAMAAASGAQAQSAGQWTAKFGFNKITPHVESGDVSAPALPGSKADVGADTQPVVVFDYALTDHVTVETALGLPYKHKLYGAGAIAGTGELGETEALPPTVFLQYRFFEPKAMIRPYAGVGLTYAWFRKTTGSGQLTAISNVGGAPVTFKVDNKLTTSLQLGVTVNVNERWFVDAAFAKTFLKTTVHFSTGQTQEQTLDPQAVTLAVGYKF